MKPLFIPLKSEFYDAVAVGTKGTAYRRLGARWNERTCYPGRLVTLSKGYGKKHRLSAVIVSVHFDHCPWLNLAGWRDCYGGAGSGSAICIKIRIADYR